MPFLSENVYQKCYYQLVRHCNNEGWNVHLGFNNGAVTPGGGVERRDVERRPDEIYTHALRTPARQRECINAATSESEMELRNEALWPMSDKLSRQCKPILHYRKKIITPRDRLKDLSFNEQRIFNLLKQPKEESERKEEREEKKS